MNKQELLKKFCKIFNCAYDVVIDAINDDFTEEDAIYEMIFNEYAPLKNEKIEITKESNNIIDLIKKCNDEKINKNYIKDICYQYVDDLELSKNDYEKLNILIDATIETI